MRFEHVRVLPFVGEKYGQENPWGLPLMVLGESHYSEGPLYPEFTQEVVQMVIEADWKPWMNFFTRAVGVFHGGWCSREARSEFWSSAVFYNYIQETVGAQSRIRPSARMWLDAAPAFEEVLIQFEPKFVLVLGTELWANLPPPVKPGPPVRLPDGQTRESRLYFNDAGYAFAFGIAHPSSVGWSYEEWTPWVQAAIKAAVEFQSAQME